MSIFMKLICETYYTSSKMLRISSVALRVLLHRHSLEIHFHLCPRNRTLPIPAKKRAWESSHANKKSHQKCKQSEYTKKHPYLYRWVITFCLYAFRGILSSANNQVLNLLFVCVILLLILKSLGLRSPAIVCQSICCEFIAAPLMPNRPFFGLL